MLSALDERIHQHDDEPAQLVLFCTAPSFQSLNARHVLLDCDAMVAPRRSGRRDMRSGIDLPIPRQRAAEYVPN
jgi:hypothetical protein